MFMLLFSVGAIAQETVGTITELAPEFNALLSFFLPAVTGLALALWADASKHLRAGTWDTGIFLKTKLKPFIITVLLSVALYYALIYVPFLKPFIEVLAGQELVEVTAAGFFGLAGAIIDGLTKSKEGVE